MGAEQMERTFEIMRQIAGLAGILAGFCFTGALQLVSMNRKGKLVSLAVLTFNLATFALLCSVVGQVFIQVDLHAQLRETGNVEQKVIDEYANIFVYLVFVTFLGVVLLIAAVTMSSWLQSKYLGAITTLSAVVTIFLITKILVVILRL